jgi:hypothetical protein
MEKAAEAASRRKGELSANKIGRERPYQIAVPADQITGKNDDIMHEFCRGLSRCPRGTRRGGMMSHTVFSVSPMRHAEGFCARFGGERFGPNDRGRGSAWFL